MEKRGKLADSPAQARSGRQALVVLPKSLLRNWVNELNQWGSFAHATLYGSADQKAAALEAARSGTAEVLLTTYDVYTSRLADLQDIEWSVIVFDEAHCLQNPETQTYKAAQAAPDCAFKLLLSGTPGSNKLVQMHAMLDLAVPDCLGSRAQFKDFYARTINFGLRIDAAPDELAMSKIRSARLKRIVDEHMLQRKKADAAVQEQLREMQMTLPRKREQVIFCQLSPLQRRAYDRMLATEDFELLRRYAEPCNCGSGEKCVALCRAPLPRMHRITHPHLMRARTPMYQARPVLPHGLRRRLLQHDGP